MCEPVVSKKSYIHLFITVCIYHRKANICLKCWDFMTISIKIIDKALRGTHVDISPLSLIVDDFNFKHLLWVYSGRRGVHCWVSDKSARQLSGESRRAVVSYLEVIKVRIHYQH